MIGEMAQQSHFRYVRTTWISRRLCDDDGRGVIIEAGARAWRLEALHRAGELQFFNGGSHRVLYYWHAVGNKIITTFPNVSTNLNLTDIEVGAKAFRREIIDKIRLREDRFGFEPEFTAKVAALDGLRIYEVPISYHGRTYAEGKKITWRDGIAALWHIIKYNFLVSR